MKNASASGRSVFVKTVIQSLVVTKLYLFVKNAQSILNIFMKDIKMVRYQVVT
jgi:hypothetical protein